MTHITLSNASIAFPLHQYKNVSLREHVIELVGGSFGKRGHKPVVHALKNVNLEITEGDRLAVIGRNGAGKTTFLRVLAGILEVDEGECIIEGSIASITNLGLGMEPEATGYENIVMRGIFMGLTRKKAKALIPVVEEFCELGEFLNLPIKTYSSGMRVRLAFAICTSIQSDILILDEVIGTGDASFLEKAQKRMQNLIQSTKIVVMASHNDTVLGDLCNKAIWIEKGEIVAEGSVADTLAQYHAHLRKDTHLNVGAAVS